MLAAGVVPATAAAQAKVVAQRKVEGQVVNGDKAPVQGAVVYIENPKTLDVRSYLSDAQGHFHFSQVAPQTDFEVWAEQNGVQSKHKFISQFSSHLNYNFILKLEAKKKKKFLGIF